MSWVIMIKEIFTLVSTQQSFNRGIRNNSLILSLIKKNKYNFPKIAHRACLSSFFQSDNNKHSSHFDVMFNN